MASPAVLMLTGHGHILYSCKTCETCKPRRGILTHGRLSWRREERHGLPGGQRGAHSDAGEPDLRYSSQGDLRGAQMPAGGHSAGGAQRIASPTGPVAGRESHRGIRPVAAEISAFLKIQEDTNGKGLRCSPKC